MRKPRFCRIKVVTPADPPSADQPQAEAGVQDYTGARLIAPSYWIPVDTGMTEKPETDHLEAVLDRAK